MRERRTSRALERIARKAARLVVVLDYDGTLVPIAATPDLAAPDDELLKLLARLAANPRIEVHVVSGRARDALEEWLGDLPVCLWAEHGAFRHRPGSSWESMVAIPDGWNEEVDAAMAFVTATTPGSLLERKKAAVAWHYRNVAPNVAEERAGILRARLAPALEDGRLELVEGRKVIEVRPRGVNKGIVARHLPAAPEATIIAVGDDRTDDDLFEALPPSSVKVAVGAERRLAGYVLPDYRAVRDWLSALAG